MASSKIIIKKKEKSSYANVQAAVDANKGNKGKYIEPVAVAPNPFTAAPPKTAFGTSSAQYGQVSPTGQVEVPGLKTSAPSNQVLPNPFSNIIPKSAYGTSSAQYGQVSPSGQVEVPPSGSLSQSSNLPSGGVTNQASSAQTSSSQQGQGSVNTRDVIVQNSKGESQTITIDASKPYIDQVGKYEFDFWTPEGQKERIDNALSTTNPFRLSPTEFGGNYVPGASEATTSLIIAVNAANVIAAGSNVFRILGTMGKVGSVAMTPGGAKILASTIPEASGTLPWLAKTGISASLPAAGEAVVNTKNAATMIDFIKNLPLGSKLTSIGGILVLLGATGNGVLTTTEDKVKFSKDSGDLQLKLREEGLSDMADELYDTNKDLVEGLDQLKPYLPIFGKAWAGSQITSARDELNDANRAYETLIKAKNDKKIEDAKILDRERELQDRADTRAYDEKQAEQDRQNKLVDVADQRKYSEEQKNEQRQYNEQQQEITDSSQYVSDAASLESSGESTLTFGLLNTGGSPQFVDKDKAAQVYFGKDYDKLNPEQQMLLNLLKGGN